MKCIKLINTGEIFRVKDDEAQKKVDSKSYTYTNKQQWKKQKYGEYYQSVEEVREELPANVEGSPEFNKANEKKKKRTKK